MPSGDARIGWGRATASAVTILGLGTACFVVLPNWMLTHLDGVSRNGRVAIATVTFLALLIAAAWALRRFQARGQI